MESPDDIKTARELQHGITVTAPASHPHTCTERAGRATTIAQAGADYFAKLKRYIDLDPPAHWHPRLSPAAQAIVDDSSSVTTEELAAGVAEGEELILRGNGSDAVKRNGWSSGRAATGSGNEILKRAVGAKFGLGGHQAIENRSMLPADALGNRIDGTKPLTLLCGRQQTTMQCVLVPYRIRPRHVPVENAIDRWSLATAPQT